MASLLFPFEWMNECFALNRLFVGHSQFPLNFIFSTSSRLTGFYGQKASSPFCCSPQPAYGYGGYMAQLPLAAHSRLERRPPRWGSLEEHLWPPAYGHSPIPSFLSPILPFPILFHTALPNRPIPGSIPPPSLLCFAVALLFFGPGRTRTAHPILPPFLFHSLTSPPKTIHQKDRHQRPHPPHQQ